MVWRSQNPAVESQPLHRRDHWFLRKHCYVDKFTKYYRHNDLHCDMLLIKHGPTTEAATTGMVGQVMIWSYDSNTPFSKKQSCAYVCTTRDLLGLQGACWVYKGLGSTSDHPISSKHYKSSYFGHKSLVRIFLFVFLQTAFSSFGLISHICWAIASPGPSLWALKVTTTLHLQIWNPLFF